MSSRLRLRAAGDGQLVLGVADPLFHLPAVSGRLAAVDRCQLRLCLLELLRGPCVVGVLGPGEPDLAHLEAVEDLAGLEEARQVVPVLVGGDEQVEPAAGRLDHVAGDGREGLFLASSGSYDAIILDRMLPGIDGLAMLGALRAAEIGTPSLILSALGSVDDRVKGLRAGGDDYLVKPFAFSELLARIEALLRRGAAGTTTTKLRVADLELDLLTRAVK